MSFNGVMALILRYFTEFGSFRGALRQNGWRYRRKKFTFAISSISWWVSCSISFQRSVGAFIFFYFLCLYVHVFYLFRFFSVVSLFYPVVLHLAYMFLNLVCSRRTTQASLWWWWPMPNGWQNDKWDGADCVCCCGCHVRQLCVC